MNDSFSPESNVMRPCPFHSGLEVRVCQLEKKDASQDKDIKEVRDLLTNIKLWVIFTLGGVVVQLLLSVYAATNNHACS